VHALGPSDVGLQLPASDLSFDTIAPLRAGYNALDVRVASLESRVASPRCGIERRESWRAV